MEPALTVPIYWVIAYLAIAVGALTVQMDIIVASMELVRIALKFFQIVSLVLTHPLALVV